jgi:iron complex transport system ATP-binding protein
MTNHLVLSQLQFGYGAKCILDGISQALPLGKMVAICGLNGAGKSSFFKILAGLENHYTGEITLNKIPLRTINIKDRAKHIAFVTTDRPRLRGLDVRTLLELGAHDRIPPHQLTDHLNHVLKVTQTSHLADHSLMHLSDGEMQKVMMARALAQNTSLIIADEPTAFLDYQAKKDMMKLMAQLAHQQGKLILFSSHDLELTKEFADIRFELANGKLKEIPFDHLI